MKLYMLIGVLLTLTACACGGKRSDGAESSVWVPTCHEVNCIEHSIVDKRKLGTEMSIKRCIENVSSMYRYISTDSGWKLLEIESRGVSACPEK